ncbi:MAG: PH domain-containing protein [Patescibacteria group bacterium]
MPKDLKPKSKALSAFNVLPTGYFAEIEQDEATILMLRAHPITQIPWIFNAIVGFIALIIFNLFVSPYTTFRILLRVDLLGFLFLFAYVWYNFLLWYYTVGFVTNRRFIDVDYYGIVKRVVSQAPLIKLSDVTAKVAGFFGQIYNYGNVYVNTEGTAQNIEYLDIPSPDEVVAIINDLATEAAENDN